MCSMKCFTIYSFTGILFLLFVYTLLSTQPFFITGIQNLDTAKSSALGALTLFVGLFVCSIFGLWKSARDEMLDNRGRGSYGRLNNNGGGELNINLDYQMSDTS